MGRNHQLVSLQLNCIPETTFICYDNRPAPAVTRQYENGNQKEAEMCQRNVVSNSNE